MVRGCQPHTQPPSWRTAPCRLSMVAYSMYLQLTITEDSPSIRDPRTHHAVVTGTHQSYENSVRRIQCQSRQERLFKPTIGNESLHKISNVNVIRVVNFATSKNLRVKSMMFPHRNIHKYIHGSLRMGKPTIRLTIFWETGEDILVYSMFDHSGQQTVILTTIWWWQKFGKD
jgi:hypothetical protein